MEIITFLSHRDGEAFLIGGAGTRERERETFIGNFAYWPNGNCMVGLFVSSLPWNCLIRLCQSVHLRNGHCVHAMSHVCVCVCGRERKREK